MADDATMTIKAVLLPDEIQAVLKDLTFSYTPADVSEKWFYGIINVPHNTGSVDLISGKFLANAGGVQTGFSNQDIATTDKIRFLFIKNTDVTDSLYLVLDGSSVTFESTNAIEIGPGESWFAKLPNTTIADLHAINGGPGAADAGDANIQCTVAAIIHDVSI
jgi:hypothetical protein